MPTLKQVLLNKDSERRLPAGDFLPKGLHPQGSGVLHLEVPDGLSKLLLQDRVPRPWLRKTNERDGGKALHQGGEVASASQVDDASGKSGAAASGMGGR